MMVEGEPSGWLTLFRTENKWHHHDFIAIVKDDQCDR